MRIREKADRYSWCGQSLEQMELELKRFMQEGFRIPGEPGGWWHQYVCPEHHTELEFDPLEADADTFRCPHGCTMQGEPYRGGWLVFKHQSLARYALQAAAVYAGTGKSIYAELGRDILIRYAVQFPGYPIHPDAQPWMLKGRAFHQALSEAIWATTLIRAFLLLKDEGVEFGESSMEALRTFLSMLEESMRQYRHILIHERGTPESNYTAWLNAALACVYAAWNDQEKLQGLIEGKGGFLDHLSIGVKPDQFEYEGSTYYHVFVLRAYLIAAEMAERFGIDLYSAQGDKGQSLEGMFDVLADLANDLGELPAIHDGPYKRAPYAREIAEIMEIGLSKYRGKRSYVPILAEAYRQLNGDYRSRSGLEAVVFGSGDWDWREGPEGLEGRERLEPRERREPRRSRLLAESGFAILRHPANPLTALVDFGQHGGSHGHYDKLHLSIDHRAGAVTPELGMVPYGSPLRKEWYASTASHNTVSVGGKSQAAHTGEYVVYESNEEFSYVWVRSTEAYDHCVLNRHLYITEEWLLDWFEVEYEEEQQIDWWLHHLGTARDLVAEDWTPIEEALGETDGYPMAQAFSRWMQEREAYVLHLPVGGNGENGYVQIAGLASSQSAVFEFESPGTADDPSRRMHGLLHRQVGRKALFVHVYGDSNSSPLELHWKRSGDKDGIAAAVEISGSNVSSMFTLSGQSGLKKV